MLSPVVPPEFGRASHQSVTIPSFLLRFQLRFQLRFSCVFREGSAVQNRHRRRRNRGVVIRCGGEEYVLQFAAAATATRFYNQAWAKYRACLSFTESLMVGKATVDTLSVTKSTVSGDRAFLVTQGVTLAGHSNHRRALYLLYLYVVAGTNVYSLSDNSETNAEPSVTLMGDLIHRVQALYPHH
jgi:hypothetical protein